MSARRTLAEALRRLAARLDPPAPGDESPPALPDGDFLMLRMPGLLALARAEAATHGPGVLRPSSTTRLHHSASRGRCSAWPSRRRGRGGWTWPATP